MFKTFKLYEREYKNERTGQTFKQYRGTFLNNTQTDLKYFDVRFVGDTQALAELNKTINEAKLDNDAKLNGDDLFFAGYIERAVERTYAKKDGTTGTSHTLYISAVTVARPQQFSINAELKDEFDKLKAIIKDTRTNKLKSILD